MKLLKNRFAEHFPSHGEPNIKQLYLITLFGNGWFQIGNWLLFVLLFMTAPQFAVFEAIAFGTGILLEIPSGALADQIGRKRTIVLGTFLQAVGSILFIFGSVHVAYFFVGNLLLVSSFAFISGSLEAIVYDSLKQKNKVQYFDEILGKSRSLGIAAMALAGVAGGVLWQVNMHIPLGLTAVSFVIAFLASLKLIEPEIDTERFTLRSFVLQTKKGLHYLFGTAFRKYTFSFFVILASYIMWSEGFIRILMAKGFGFDGATTNYLLSLTLILGLLATYHFASIRKRFGDLAGFSLVLVASAIMWLIAGYVTNSWLIGVIVFSVISVTGSLAQVWTSVVLNSHVQTKDRATALSTLSFLVQIPYVFVLVTLSDIASQNELRLLYIIIGLLLALGSVSFYRAEKSSILVKK